MLDRSASATHLARSRALFVLRNFAGTLDTPAASTAIVRLHTPSRDILEIKPFQLMTSRGVKRLDI